MSDDTFGTEVPAWSAVSGLPRGDASSFDVCVQQIQIAGAEPVDLPSSGVTAIVGANNSGKSTLLRQLHYHLTAPHALEQEPVRLVGGFSIARTGAVSDLLAWLDLHARYHRPLPHERHLGVFSRPSGGVELQTASTAWAGSNELFSNLGQVLVYYADVQSRLNNVGGVGQRNDVGDPPAHPLHLLQDDATLRTELNELCKSIFGDPLTLDHLSGTMQLRVGVSAEPAPAADESQAVYRAALAALPLLGAQGDGMKSLLGLLLPIVTATYPVIIVDEPEAFLHPPQAHALGKALGKLAEQRSLQIILATHDRNLLAGLLASDAPLSVVRLSRDGNVTRASQLPPDKVDQLWSDPVLKYSNVLEGLFHRLVVVAEADRDCRFYEAALDAYATSGKTSIPASDVLFVPSYGKSAMHRLASILDAVDVPVVTSPDLDVLNEEAIIQRLTESLHGDWASMKRDYTVATNAFRQPRDAAKIAHVRDALNRLFDDLTRDKPDASYTSDVRDEALAAMRSRENPWQALKDYGMNAFAGEGAPAAERLVARLDEIGVVVVRVGELEGFAPLIGVAKGSEWLAAAISAGAHTDDAAQAHIARILNRVEEVSDHLVVPKVERRETTALTSPDR